MYSQTGERFQSTVPLLKCRTVLVFYLCRICQKQTNFDKIKNSCISCHNRQSQFHSFIVKIELLLKNLNTVYINKRNQFLTDKPVNINKNTGTIFAWRQPTDNTFFANGQRKWTHVLKFATQFVPHINSANWSCLRQIVSFHL